MTAPTVDRRDITLREEPREELREEEVPFGVAPPPPVWVAELDGPLSTDLRVQITRDGPSAEGALQALLDAITEQGWAVAERSGR